MLFKAIIKALPWVITVVALYFAFRGIDWSMLLHYLKGASPALLLLAILGTCLSYILRAWRWRYLFAEKAITFFDACCVLILGFFMNNVLPARAGELVRAHLGAKVTGQTRTLVLATIASERLADGLTISIMFVAFAFGLGNQELSSELLYVAVFFAAATICVAIVLVNRPLLFKLVEKITQRINSPASRYTANRIQVFLNGLSPLYSRRGAPLISSWSLIIWMVELLVYYLIERAYGVTLPVPATVLFLVAVNFSSLIPAAPGAIGVIEAVTTAALVSIGVEKELALSMVLTQHVIQYIVVGVPGAAVMLNWKSRIREAQCGAVDEPE